MFSETNIVELLNEEIKLLKQTFPMDYSADSSYTTAKSRNSRAQPTSQSPTDRLNSSAIPTTNKYAVLVVNRYAPLSNHCEQQIFQDSISTIPMKQPPEFLSVSIYKSVKGSRRYKTSMMNQHSSPGNHQPAKPFPKIPKENNDGPFCIPTIMNSVTSVNYNSQSDHKCSVSSENSTKLNSPLQTTVKLNSSKNIVMPTCRKHKILIIGDSLARGLSEKISNSLDNTFTVFGITKPMLIQKQ
jgi:hypothetical protein